MWEQCKDPVHLLKDSTSKQTTSFSEWWLATAKLLLHAHTKESKVKAIKELFKLTENMFPCVEEEEFEILYAQEDELMKLYREKIEISETYNIDLKNKYCQMINSSFQAYHDCYIAYLNEKEELHATTRKYASIANQPLFRGVKIDEKTRINMLSTLRQKYENEEERQKAIYDNKIKSLRQMYTSMPTIAEPDYSLLDEKIKEIEQVIGDDEVNSKYRRLYRQISINLDHTMAEKLSVECQQWLKHLI